MIAALLPFALTMAIPPLTDDAPRKWNFDDQPVGKLAAGFTAHGGNWAVVAPDHGKALAQSGQYERSAFSLVLVDDTNAKDVDVSVRFESVGGEGDRGGGVVFRASDEKNYYIVRYSDSEDNFRLWKMVGGKRSLVATANIPRKAGWHTIRARMTGDHLVADYDGKTYLDVHDSALTAAGKIGLWTKGDAQTRFDDLELIGH